MGTGPVPLKVNSRGKKNFECMEEMHAFMQCAAVKTEMLVHSLLVIHNYDSHRLTALFGDCSVLVQMVMQRVAN